MKSTSIVMRRAGLAALVGCTVAAMGCSGGGGVRADEGPIGIGILADVDFEVGERGARLAVDRVNREGGLFLGGRRRPVELIVESVPRDAKASLTKAMDLVYRRRVVALLGPRNTKPALPVATLADATGVPMILPVDVDASVTRARSFVFRTVPRDAVQGLSLARFVNEEFAGKRVAAVFDSTHPDSSALAQAFRVGTTGASGKVRGFDLGGENEEIIKTLRRERPAAVVLLVEQERAIALARSLKGMDAETRLVALEPGDAAAWTTAGIDPIELVVAWHPSLPTVENRDFLRAFSEAHDASPRTADAHAFDAIGLLFAAMTRADTAEPGAVQRSLRWLEGYRGASGTFSYGVSSDPSKPLAMIGVRGSEAIFRRWLEPY